MKVVAGLFDSQSDATNAMDELLRSNLEGLETKVYETGSRSDAVEGAANVVIPIIPTTSSTGLGQPGQSAAMAIGAAGLDREWLDEFDDEERAFYHEGYKEGATLALAKVKDEDVSRVRDLLRRFQARTYVKG